MSRNAWIAVTVALVIAGLFILGSRAALDWLYEESGLAEFDRIDKGMTHDKVVQILGQPYQSYTAQQAPRDYYVDGYGHPERQITGEVLIYISGEYIAYIYLDSNGKAEDLFVHGS